MTVHRISTGALQRILQGELKKPIRCFIKFYSNTCPLCKRLQPTFHKIAEKNHTDTTHFYAFNVADLPGITKRLKLDGVPSIIYVDTEPPTRVETLEDPKEPHEDLYYHPKDIIQFVKRNKENE